jgi:nicotinamide-nucleotide amidase
MAEGIRTRNGTDIGLSITGIAGPGGGVPGKPVGLVYIALSHDGGTRTYKFNLWGDRKRIRHLACLHSLDIIRRHLMDQGSEGYEI